MKKEELRPYQKKMIKLPNNPTQFRSEEGEITIQSCGKLHPLTEAWLDPKDDNKKGRFVLCCPVCRYYMEIPSVGGN